MLWKCTLSIYWECLTFKQNERRNLKAWYLFNEIKTYYIWKNTSKTASFDTIEKRVMHFKSGSNIFLTFRKPFIPIFRDVYKILFYVRKLSSCAFSIWVQHSDISFGMYSIFTLILYALRQNKILTKYLQWK